MKFTKETALQIHNELHAKNPKDLIGNSSVYLSTNGCKAVNIEGYIFMEQNKKKNSKWSSLAKEGHKVTWIIPASGNWGRIVDNDVQSII